MEKSCTFNCGLTINSPSMADRNLQTILDDRTSIRKCAAPGIPCVRSKCMNEQMSGATERECTDEDLSDMFITPRIHTYNKQLKCCHTKYGYIFGDTTHSANITHLLVPLMNPFIPFFNFMGPVRGGSWSAIVTTWP